MLIKMLSHFLKPAYLYLSSKKYRSFAKLKFKLANISKYQTQKVKFSNYLIQVPDAPSFLDQYEAIFFKESYFFKTESTIPRIIDCGANAGVASIYFKSIYPNALITAIEADPQIASLLRSNLTNNNFSDIELVQKAVWINSDGVNFQEEGGQGGKIEKSNKSNLEQTPSMRLKELLVEENKIDCLKLDIEGAEYEVLIDCQEELKKIDNLFVEYHVFKSRKNELDKLLNLISSEGFKYFLQNNSIEKPFLLESNKEVEYTVEIFAKR